MDRELDRLKKEISILNERIKVLEGKEHRRSIAKSIKNLINIVLICLVIFGAWKAYDYVTNYIPNYLEEKIDDLNPFFDTKTSDL